MLVVKNLEKNFGKTKVLKKINLQVNEKERLVIIGPSGCGKSTLLRCINHIEKPTSGKVLFEGIPLANDDELYKIRIKMGMVFQQFNLFPHLTVLENIILAPVKLKLMSKEEAIKKARELLEKIHLSDKENNYPKELSGGQQQRTSIGRALITKPSILLCDEPTGNLDSKASDEIMSILKKTNKLYIVLIIHSSNHETIS